MIKRMAELYPKFRAREIISAEKWDDTFLRLIIEKFQRWDNILEELKNVQSQVEPEPIILKLRKDLGSLIAQALKAILESRQVYRGKIPEETLYWLIELEKRGINVIHPPMLYNCDNILGVVLAESYSFSVGPGKNPFISVLLNQLLPTLNKSAATPNAGHDRRLSYAQDFCAVVHFLTPLTKTQVSSQTVVYEPISPENLQKIRRHIGSLLFFGETFDNYAMIEFTNNC
jgi:hypothetical protein